MEEGQLGKDSRGRQQVAHYFVMGFLILSVQMMTQHGPGFEWMWSQI